MQQYANDAAHTCIQRRNKLNERPMESLRRLEAFVHTARSSSFTKAGAALGLDPTSVSRAVTELEEELGVVLLQRSTRALRLTDDGAAFHERIARVLDDLVDAKRSVSASTAAPSGTLRVDAPVALGRARIAPIVIALSREHPALTIHLTLHDRLVDPRTEDVDILVRLNGPREPSLVARPLGESRMVVCASKRVIARHGRPRTPSDLTRLPCLGYLRHGKPEAWRLRLPKEDGRLVEVVPRGAPGLQVAQ